MAPRVTSVDLIVPGKIEWKVHVRVLNLWEVPDFKNPHLTTSLKMLLVDENSNKIHVTVKRTLIQQFKNVLEEGSCYLLENLLVAKNEMKFRTTNHQYKLSLMGTTKCVKTESQQIPTYAYDFVSFPQIIAGRDEGTLFDVIGHVVEKDEMKELEKNGITSKLIDFMLEDQEKNRLFCTLWGQFAEQFHQYVTANESNGTVVVILYMCRLNKFGGQNGVSNAYNGTKLLMNPDIPECSNYKNTLGNGTVSLTPMLSQMTNVSAVPLAEDLLQTIRMTISDLMDATEKCMCVVLATILDVDLDKGWCYEACTRCAKKVVPVGNRFYCEGCEKMMPAVLRYKLNIQVIDNTGSATFVLFDRLLTQFLGGRTAKEQMDLINKGKASADYPVELDTLIGKQKLFKVEMSQGNINRTWDTYIVKRMYDDQEIMDKFNKKYSFKDEDDDDGQDLRATVTPVIDDNMKDDANDGNNVGKDVLSQEHPHLEDISTELTPTSKAIRKRNAESLVVCVDDDDGAQTSSTKVQKVVDVKQEPSD